MKYCDVVEYNGKKLFSGAIDIDDYLKAPEKAKEIASCYIFHGNKKHEDDNSGHELTDSISLVERVIEALESDSPELLLGIAGYGVGKSHLGLTLSYLLSTTDKNGKETILKNIALIDKEAESRIKESIYSDDRPFLVVPINGMRNVNLKDLFFQTIKTILMRDGVDSSCLDKFDPRFSALKELLFNYNNQSLVIEVLNTCGQTIKSFSEAMDSLNSEIYERVKIQAQEKGIKYYEPAATGELKDILSSVSTALCGVDKPYRSMLIVFDEFGKYMSFAAANDGTAGPGCMQLLFEGITSNYEKDGHIVLLGLSQLDLKEYQMGSGDIAFTNNMSRYVSRYDTARKFYLSACFETLVANLLSVKDTSFFPDSDKESLKTKSIYKNLLKTFKQVAVNDIWSDYDKYLSLIVKGCWPLSPYLMWTLSYITSINNLLQQRSGFNLLLNLFENDVYSCEITRAEDNTIVATRLFDAGLLSELLESEKNYQTSDPIATEYVFLLQKYSTKLSKKEVEFLKSIVLAHKLRANCSTQNEMNSLLKELAGLSSSEINHCVDSLCNYYNAVDYNQAMGQYEIHSDSISVQQFSIAITKRTKDYKLQRSRQEQYECVSSLFNYSKDIYDIKETFFTPVKTAFSENHDLSTSEWNYSPFVVIGYNFLNALDTNIKISDFLNNIVHDDPKGRVFYIILPKDVSLQNAKKDIKQLLNKKSAELGYTLPVLVLILRDSDDEILDSSIEYTVISHLSKEDQEKYQTLIIRKKEGLLRTISDSIERARTERNYVYPEGIDTKKSLQLAGTQLFEMIYPEVIPFYIDGKNWLSSVEQMIKVLSKGNVTWNDILNLSDPKIINRVKHLFRNLWESIDEKGRFLRIPEQETLNEVYTEYDELVANEDSIRLLDLYEKLVKPPFGANTTAATLIVFYYLSTRSLEFDFVRIDATITLLDLLAIKGSLNKYKAFNPNIWNQVFIRKAIRDDAKWVMLINRWSDETEYEKLMECSKKAKELQNLNISVPPQFASQLAACINHSELAEGIYNEWNEKSQTIKEEIDIEINKNRIGKPLNLFCRDYLKLYNNTIVKASKGNPRIHMPEDITEKETEFQESFRQYIGDHIEEWVEEHLFSFNMNVNEFKESHTKYEYFSKNLYTAGLDLYSEEINKLISEVDDKRKCYLEFNKLYRQVDNEYQNLEKLIKNGLYSSSQVKSCLNSLNVMLDTINKFDVIKLSKIQGYSFDSLIKAIKGSINSIEKLGKEKDEKFSSLFEMDISSVDDLDYIISVSSDLFLFYKGLGDIKNDNLEDAEIMNKEASMLKGAYNNIFKENLSVQDLDNLVNEEKERLSNAFDGDSIFDDDSILNRFADKKRDEIINKSKNWINIQENVLKKSSSAQEINRVLYSIDLIPHYAEGVIDEEVLILKNNANKKLSFVKMDYLKGLFRELSKEEKVFFVNWCKKESM